ncbi:MAG: host attachment family protein [Pseudolabrys sp.]|nr:host attachment family protein [Pseudolabrys sp.]
MTALSIQPGEWVVVCDGAKALVLENIGDAKFPNLKTRDVYEQKVLATHELGTGAPGRSHSSTGAGSSSVEQTDWHDQQEKAFLTDLAHTLEAAVKSHQLKSLIVVAPPRALGVMRQHYGHALKGAVRAELDKDYVKMPIHEIEKHLTAAAA